MKQPKFKPGQQWLTQDGSYTFHVLSVHSDMVYCMGVSVGCSGTKLSFYVESGRLFKNTGSPYDLVTLVKDVE